MKNLNESEAISLVVALSVVAVIFFGAFGNPFAKTAADTTKASDTVVLSDVADKPTEASAALLAATNPNGDITKLIIEDSKVGDGTAVKVGDTVTVHYVGVLQNGTEFDNSLKRGEPFTFTVGQGRVIKGWDEGLVGMKVGGERILVIPADKGYGREANGPIPANSTLLFSVSLLSIAK